MFKLTLPRRKLVSEGLLSAGPVELIRTRRIVRPSLRSLSARNLDPEDCALQVQIPRSKSTMAALAGFGMEPMQALNPGKSVMGSAIGHPSSYTSKRALTYQGA